ncbi:MAG TPA: ester cyclase [Dehalococcoidia bacterium]|nr:ester cyclase [Dehalococcoidia bacterium]
MNEQMKQITRRLYEVGFAQGRLDVIDELIAPDAVDHAGLPGLPPGREGVKHFISMVRAAFSDIRFTVEDLIAEGDKVVARYRMTGTHKGEFLGIAATGRSVTVSGIDIIRFAGDKMVEHWGQDDQLGLLQQLGAIRAPTGATA